MHKNDPNNLNEQLVIAAGKGDLNQVSLLVSANAGVHHKNKYGETALISAARYDRRDVCELLVANRADVNAKNRRGETALISAAFYGCVEACELLVSKTTEQICMRKTTMRTQH